MSSKELTPCAQTVPPAVTAADLTVGRTFETGEATLRAEDVTDFACRFDPQPVHLSEALAAETVFGRRVASGWHVLALTMRLIVDSHPFGATPIIGVEIERIRFQRPVPPGMKLRVRARIDEIEPSRRPGRAIAALTVETLDATAGEVLIEQHWKLLLPSGRNG